MDITRDTGECHQNEHLGLSLRRPGKEWAQIDRWMEWTHHHPFLPFPIPSLGCCLPPALLSAPRTPAAAAAAGGFSQITAASRFHSISKQLRYAPISFFLFFPSPFNRKTASHNGISSQILPLVSSAVHSEILV